MKKNFYKCLFVLPLFSSLTIGNTNAKENVKYLLQKRMYYNY